MFCNHRVSAFLSDPDPRPRTCRRLPGSAVSAPWASSFLQNPPAPRTSSARPTPVAPVAVATRLRVGERSDNPVGADLRLGGERDHQPFGGLAIGRVND